MGDGCSSYIFMYAILKAPPGTRWKFAKAVNVMKLFCWIVHNPRELYLSPSNKNKLNQTNWSRGIWTNIGLVVPIRDKLIKMSRGKKE